MRMISVIAAFFVVLILGVPATAAEPPAPALDAALGVPGKELAGGVRRYGWPRRDLKVTLGGVTLEPALALGSWGAFLPLPAGGTMAMGDLALLEDELGPVVAALQAHGLDVMAIHNHLVGENPHVVYVHFGGHGDAVKLAKALRGALEKTKTPLGAAPAAAAVPEAERALLGRVEAALGRSGSMAGRVLQVSVPRAGTIEEHGAEIPASMGMATALNFQAAGTRVATTGDFVLVASEVNPVLRALVAGGLSPTALHSHMLEESPRLFFVHFWGVDTPEHVGGALKSALANVVVQPAK